ncbi:MAG: hypothetical protein WD048_01230 [Chitinophagales bacterium]
MKQRFLFFIAVVSLYYIFFLPMLYAGGSFFHSEFRQLIPGLFLPKAINILNAKTWTSSQIEKIFIYSTKLTFYP